ncbi:hypothetical protein HK104_004187 [Borealophlyctis nickersoniae]|nr:hypothetical protein HK104_004187 [Borealophlyctis nickersoniae]
MVVPMPESERGTYLGTPPLDFSVQHYRTIYSSGPCIIRGVHSPTPSTHTTPFVSLPVRLPSPQPERYRVARYPPGADDILDFGDESCESEDSDADSDEDKEDEGDGEDEAVNRWPAGIAAYASPSRSPAPRQTNRSWDLLNSGDWLDQESNDEVDYGGPDDSSASDDDYNYQYLPVTEHAPTTSDFFSSEEDDDESITTTTPHHLPTLRTSPPYLLDTLLRRTAVDPAPPAPAGTGPMMTVGPSPLVSSASSSPPNAPEPIDEEAIRRQFFAQVRAAQYFLPNGGFSAHEIEEMLAETLERQRRIRGGDANGFGRTASAAAGGRDGRRVGGERAAAAAAAAGVASETGAVARPNGEDVEPPVPTRTTSNTGSSLNGSFLNGSFLDELVPDFLDRHAPLHSIIDHLRKRKREDDDEGPVR